MVTFVVNILIILEYIFQSSLLTDLKKRERERKKNYPSKIILS